MGDLRKKIVLAISGFLVAFLVGLGIYLVKYRAQSRGSTSIRSARIEESGNQSSFKFNASRLGTNEALDFIYVVSPRQTWAGTHTGLLFKIYDNGNNWERLELPVRGFVSSAYFSSESSGWLLLQQYDPALDKTKFRASILHTEDGGRSWASQFTSGAIELVEISFASPNELWAIGASFKRQGDTLNADLFLLHTNNGGSTWNDVSTGLNKAMAHCSGSSSQYPGTIQANGSGTLLLMSDIGWGLSTSDGGVRWQCSGRFETAGLRPHAFVSGMNNLVLANVGGNHGTASMLGIKQKDGSWLASSLGSVFLKDAFYVSDNELLACGSLVPNANSVNTTTDGVVLLSRDQGLNWSIIYRTSEIPALNALALRQTGQVWAVGSKGSLVRFKRTTP